MAKFCKRLFDIAASLCAIVVFLIPWLVISLIIKIQSPGPVLFCPRRIGKDGKPFTLYKFRSMRTDSGKIHATTLRGDPRIFPFGAILRKTKLDETPQLFNVLFGQMSVIGPRPEDEVNAKELYQGEFVEILSVKPGLSSPASLYDYTHGENYPDEESYVREFLPEKLKVELYYVRHRSNVYDLKVIVSTVVTILQIFCGKKDFPLPKEKALYEEEKAARDAAGIR